MINACLEVLLCDDFSMAGIQVKDLTLIVEFRKLISKSILSEIDIAKGITIIESIEDCSLLEDCLLKGKSDSSLRIGITGAPGVGKSTFMNALLTFVDSTKLRIAVVAVDPSSRRTNGAMLADRIRISNNYAFDEIFFRSMATRGAYGGLVKNIKEIMDFLQFAGFEMIILETVGVGQNEIDVSSSVDIVINLLDSNVGDEIQIEKAGIMEIGDVLFINKDDRGLNSNFISTIVKNLEYENHVFGKERKLIVGSAIELRGLTDVIDFINGKIVNKLPLKDVKNIE
jgi:LAO/AO transport system kinase